MNPKSTNNNSKIKIIRQKEKNNGEVNKTGDGSRLIVTVADKIKSARLRQGSLRKLM